MWASTFPGLSQTQEFVKNQVARVIRSGDVPRHVAFIMDGNRRYTKKHHMEIKEGHNAGFVSMSQILELCYECGVEMATVYAFSIENFNRSQQEVDWLMELAKQRIKTIVEHGQLVEQYGVRVRIVGNRSLLPEDVRAEMEQAEQLTANNSRAVLNICFPYTGRDEIVHSIRASIRDTKPEEIDEDTLNANMYITQPLDLLVRTSGMLRLSDFMIWQVQEPNVEVEIVDVLWPDFGPLHMAWILLKYGYKRARGA